MSYFTEPEYEDRILTDGITNTESELDALAHEDFVREQADEDSAYFDVEEPEPQLFQDFNDRFWPTGPTSFAY
jgi:hypothetical protein